jgi:hypothetical protein
MGAGNRLSEPFSDASRFEVYTAGQKRRVTPQIKREFKRRAAVDPVIGHLKAEHRILAGSTAFVLSATTSSVTAPTSIPTRTAPAYKLGLEGIVSKRLGAQSDRI